MGEGGDEEVLGTVLAGLTGAISRESAASLLAEWSSSPGISLAAMLREAGGLDEERMRALAKLASAHYEAHGRDLARSLAAWDVATIPIEGATTARPAPLPATRADDAPGASAADTERGRGPLDDRYELLKIHARGGIGQVWKARDRQLQREVALKELQPRLADRDDLRGRFLLEAEITGKLEHPGIVPVYSLGADEAGRPFYAMRFVQGDSLSEAIRGFHKARNRAEADGAPAGEAWGVEFRQLLRRFLGACETLEYAHSKGVIHRDLKPGNIMVGPYGETLVVDWGLAKVVGTGEAGETPPSAEGTWTPAGSGTSPGDWIGTPSYMPPEQARGDLDRVGPRSDVYSLGATLYELLTGEPPFRGPDHHAIIAAVLRGAPSPRAAVRSIPPALESICLKAMAARRRDRYESAAALARDLENWLADEPVAAHPEGRRERLARWVRRHRTRAYAAAAALLGVSLVATAAALVIDRAWRSERVARSEAEASFDQAQRAVDEYFTQVSQDTLRHEEDSVDVRRLREALLGTALRYYEGFLVERRDDPRLRRRLATAYRNVGVIRGVIATPPEAIAALDSALATWDALLADAPGDPDLVALRAETLVCLAGARNDLDDPRAAFEALSRAVADLEGVVASPGAKTKPQVELATGLSALAATAARLGRGDESRAASDRASVLLRRLLEADPRNASHRVLLAELVNDQGFAAYRAGDHDAALRAFREVQGLCLGLLDAASAGERRPNRLVELLAVSCENEGDVLTTLGRAAEARGTYERSLARASELAAAHPSVRRYRLQLGRTCRELGHVQHLAGDDAEAFRSLARAREAFEGLIREDPDRPSLRHHLARTWNTLGCLHDDRREHEAAVGPFSSAVAENRLAVDGVPDSPEYRYHLVLSLANLAEQHADLGDLDRALPAAEEAARAALDLLRSDRSRPGSFAACTDVATTLGDLAMQAGDAPRALARLDELAAAIRETRSAPSPPARDEALAAVRARRAAAALAGGQPEEAGRILSEPEAEGVQASRALRSEALWLLARVERLSGRAEEAAAAESARLALWDAPNAPGLVASASRAAARACRVGYGRAPLPEVGEAARRLDADRAADDLRLALALGFDDRARIRGDAGLMTILDREPHRPLRDDLGFPDPPFAPSPSPEAAPAR